MEGNTNSEYNEERIKHYTKILVIFVIFFIVDMVIVDPIPLVDEIAIAVGIFRNIEKVLELSYTESKSTCEEKKETSQSKEPALTDTAISKTHSQRATANVATIKGKKLPELKQLNRF